MSWRGEKLVHDQPNFDLTNYQFYVIDGVLTHDFVVHVMKSHDMNRYSGS